MIWMTEITSWTCSTSLHIPDVNTLLLSIFRLIRQRNTHLFTWHVQLPPSWKCFWKHQILTTTQKDALFSSAKKLDSTEVISSWLDNIPLKIKNACFGYIRAIQNLFLAATIISEEIMYLCLRYYLKTDQFVNYGEMWYHQLHRMTSLQCIRN